MLKEPIFYSGTGVYDFQYLDFLEKKYKYDTEWLLKNKKFDFKQTKNIVKKIKNILEEKSKKVHLYGLKERLPQIIEDMKKNKPDEDWEKYAEETQPLMELHQYVDLFFEEINHEDGLNIDNIREEGRKSFYKNLIELFVIRKSDFDDDSDIDDFLNNFSTPIEENLNSQFQGIGNFNIINAKPIIQLDDERYFVPISFLVFEAAYESPFYWMWLEDEKYRDQLGKNRGKSGEEIAYEFLKQIFGKDRTFKSVKIQTKKGKMPQT